MFQTHYLENQDIGWYDAVPLIEFAYNNSFQESIGCSPFCADLGIQPQFFISFVASKIRNMV